MLEEPYQSYNVLQRAQGFDLEPCCGKTVERCTYTVKNHPSGKVCQADLYICGGEIVAGDILCTGEGGFIAPLAFPEGRLSAHLPRFALVFRRSFFTEQKERQPFGCLSSISFRN